MPDKAKIQLHTAIDCSGAYSVTVNHGSISASTEYLLGTLNASTTELNITSTVALGRFLNIGLASMTACTDLTVLYIGYERIK